MISEMLVRIRLSLSFLPITPRESEDNMALPYRFQCSVKVELLFIVLNFQNLPKSFVRANGLETRCGDIVLMNEKGRSWTSALEQRQCGKIYITRGWRSFCSANGLKAGDIFTFKLIKRGGTLLLRKSPSHRESKEDEGSEAEEIESLSTESDSDEESNQDEKALKRRIFITRVNPPYGRDNKLKIILKHFIYERASVIINVF